MLERFVLPLEGDRPLPRLGAADAQGIGVIAVLQDKPLRSAGKTLKQMRQQPLEGNGPLLRPGAGAGDAAGN